MEWINMKRIITLTAALLALAGCEQGKTPPTPAIDDVTITRCVPEGDGALGITVRATNHGPSIRTYFVTVHTIDEDRGGLVTGSAQAVINSVEPGQTGEANGFGSTDGFTACRVAGI